MKVLEKLLQQYQQKIKMYDIKLSSIEEKLVKERAVFGKNGQIPFLQEQRTIVSDQRQIYFQVIKDLEDLL